MKPKKSDEIKAKELQARREHERKKSTSIRLSDHEREVIEKKAQELGMPMTSYIAFAAVHGTNSLSPADMAQFQNFMMDAAEKLGKYNKQEADELREGAYKLWGSLQ